MEPKKILIIEDDPEERIILTRELKKQGYIVYEAPTGEEGLRIFREDRPDLVILDIMLPGIDGWEVLRRIKKGPISRRVPVMMLTGKTEDKDKIKGYDFGADYYVTKPYNISKLLPVIKSLIEE
ncbi:MAG: response regulator [Candidatus Omnitrophica bacterium]|nr:response regulator [Candidatus Omnitrophota bacterium]MCM8806543.1 response regulator [Candidatus Omnitrophota bacterium]